MGEVCSFLLLPEDSNLSESLEFLMGPGVVLGLLYHLHLLCHRRGVLQLGHEGLDIENIIPCRGDHHVPGAGSPPGVHHVQGAGDGILPPSPAVTPHLSYRPPSPEQKNNPGPTYCSPEL